MADSEIISVERPPVAEVALAVQFEPNTINALRAALFRSRIKGDFPEYKEQVARPPIEEDFSAPSGRPPFSFEIMSATPSQRFWFLTPDGSKLIQLQHDLVAANWLRLPSGDDYPRFSQWSAVLGDSLRTLNETLEHEGESGLKPNWCEVTYINHISPFHDERGRPQLHRVFNAFHGPTRDFLPPREDAAFNERYLVAENGASPRGRLNVSVASAFRAGEEVPIWVFTLTSRIRCRDESIDGAMEVLAEGRRWADHAFAELTTAEMHDVWGLHMKEPNESSR